MASALLHIKVSQTLESLPTLFQIVSIKAVIIDLDEGQGRISLSTRVLETTLEMLEKMDEVMANACHRARQNVTE